MTDNDEKFMLRAFELARLAASMGEVPVGAVIVKDGEIIAEGYNRREVDRNATAHAELIAIDRACKKLCGWRLSACELYVTLEPCPMCAGAIINSRIKRVVCAAKDPRAGAFGSLVNLNFYPFNHKPVIEYGLFGEESSAMLRDFFARLREKRSKK